MTFRFNFAQTTSDDTINCSLAEDQLEKEDHTFNIRCEFLNLKDINIQLPDEDKTNVIHFAQLGIRYITQSNLENIGDLEVIEKTKSDLVPGKYEGGLKVWECALDLSQFIVENNCIQPGNAVLELGCGVGLPGIAAYVNGGLVTFQDFNSEVLERVTAPNVLLNTPKEERTSISQKCQFVCGDWHQLKQKYFSNKQENEKYDCILTSETLYEKCNHRKLLDLMKSALKSDGKVYLASKVHYFGVGGGILDFEKLLVDDNSFEFSTVFRTDEGVERRILQLKFKNAK